MSENHCRHFLSVTSVATANGQVQITIKQENLVDGWWYTLRIQPGSLPDGLKGTESVFVLNGTGDPSTTPPVAPVAIQLTDWRGRYLLSERLLRGGERLRMVYTENGPGAAPVPIFEITEGIVRIP